jgi:hypothetical protein
MAVRHRNTDAMANLRNAAEKGPTFWATTLPAINVPPQKTAISTSFR